MASLHPVLAQISMPGWGELLIIAFIGLLLFGKRLPEVGRSLGKGIVEFKKGLRGIEDEVENSVNRSSQTPSLPHTEPVDPAVPAAHAEGEKVDVHTQLRD